jgi:hypothetical protein
LNTFTALFDILVDLLALFTMKRMEQDIARIEVTTRGMLAEALNFRRDEWDRFGVYLEKFDLMIQAAWDIKAGIADVIRNLASIAVGLGQVPVTGGALPEVEAGPVWKQHLDDVAGWLKPIKEDIFKLRDYAERIFIPADLSRNNILIEIWNTLKVIQGSLGAMESVTVPVYASQLAAMAAGGSGITLNVTQADPAMISRILREAANARGLGRSGGTLAELNF